MEGMFKIYQGRPVSEQGFRAYMYSLDGEKKLVNSWQEFEEHLQTGLWFESEFIKDAQEEPKRTRKKRDE